MMFWGLYLACFAIALLCVKSATFAGAALLFAIGYCIGRFRAVHSPARVEEFAAAHVHRERRR